MLRARVMVKKDGRIVIPKRMRERNGIQEGTLLQLETIKKGKILLEVLVS